MTITLEVPENLIMSESIEFVKRIRGLGTCDEIRFNFRDLKRMDPLSLLLISSEIQIKRQELEDVRFIAANAIGENCKYPAHMGFFKAFGAQIGKMPGEARGGPSYVPITIYDVNQIRNDANKQMVNL